MVPLLGIPLLEHQIRLCRRHGFTQIALLVHYNHEAISDHFGDGSSFGVRISYLVEEAPRGTAGALRDALPALRERFLVLYGDTYLDVDLRALWETHSDKEAQGTLFLHPNDHPQDSDLVEVDGDGTVRGIHPYPHPPELACRNLVNAALYVLDKAGLEDFLPAEGKADLAKDIFPALLVGGVRLIGYISPEYIKDVGTPERLDKVSEDIVSGLVDRLSSRALRSAVFLDRDGTLNREVNHLSDPSQFELLPGAASAVRQLNRSGRLTVLVTNQPVLARGEMTWEGLARVHGRMDQLLGLERAYLDGIYVCPHHPHKGYPGEVPELKGPCQCRKPRTGLIDTACLSLAIDRRRSWFVGDTTSDIEAGRRSGLRTILVRTGHRGMDGKYEARPDFTVPDLPAAVNWILQGHEALTRRLLPFAATHLGEKLFLIGGAARTGKSSAAQVLREILETAGQKAHVISLDSWLRPREDRVEGEGVLTRYNLEEAWSFLATLLNASSVQETTIPEYDPIRRRPMETQGIRRIHPGDTLLVEGVPALLFKPLLRATPARLHLTAPEACRLRRVREDYSWRGLEPRAIDKLIQSRAQDEVSLVSAGAAQAALEISSGSQNDC
jgi:histidinol-phosphate phosphatase family protein